MHLDVSSLFTNPLRQVGGGRPREAAEGQGEGQREEEVPPGGRNTAERGRGGDRRVVHAQLADRPSVLGTRTKMGGLASPSHPKL